MRTDAAPFIAFDATGSLVERVYRDGHPRHSVDPRSDLAVSREDINYFEIHSPLFAAPLLHDDSARGVLLLWAKGPDGQTLTNLKACQETAMLAARHFASTIVIGQQTDRVRQLRSVVTGVGENVTQEQALRAVLEAIGDHFERVRFFTYVADDRTFIPFRAWA